MDSPEALAAALEELSELAVRLEWIAASFARLRADLQLTEGRIATLSQSIEGARGNNERALGSLREGR